MEQVKSMEMTIELDSPITQEQWDMITDVELQHSDEVEFTTPSGKKVLYRKVKYCRCLNKARCFFCSECGYGVQDVFEGNDAGDYAVYVFEAGKEWNYCPNCGAKVDEECENDI